MISNSWIVTETSTGNVILETFNPKVAAAINRNKYTVQTALEYLEQFNARLAESYRRRLTEAAEPFSTSGLIELVDKVRSHE
jgi:hypothetical protein